MKLKLFFLFLLISANVKAQIPQESAERFDRVLDSVCTKYKIKGASAAIIVPGIGKWKGVHGISHEAIAVNENMLFGIGSNTKTFISVLMLMLQEEGKLDLDDSIGNWIKNVPNVNGKTTIRQLLNHTSGIYNYTNNEDWIEEIFKDQRKIWKPEDLLKYINKPLFAPGQKWNYSNTNYLLAGMIIEKITQKPLHIALREKILSPQGLNNTYMFPAEKPGAPLAHAWTYVYDWKAPQQDIMQQADDDINAFYSSAWAAGAIMSTAEDNALFWSRLMAGLMINEASLAELKQYIKISTTVGYGLGIFRENNFHGSVVYSHGGTGFGYVNENIVDSANGIAISVLTNQDSISNGIILNQLIKALHKVTRQNKTLSVQHYGMADKQITVYPNPAHGNVYVTLPVLYEDAATISVTDLLGKEVLPAQILRATNTLHTIDITGIKAGMYLVLIRTHGQTFTRKIMIR